MRDSVIIKERFVEPRNEAIILSILDSADRGDGCSSQLEKFTEEKRKKKVV